MVIRDQKASCSFVKSEARLLMVHTVDCRLLDTSYHGHSKLDFDNVSVI